jgi:hypothetical protein
LNARNALLALAALGATTFTSCGTARRAGKDLFVTVVSPALIVYGGATDGYSTAGEVRRGLDSGGAMQVLAFPFTFLYHAFEHTLYCGAHLVDLPLCAFYAFADVNPNGPDVKPLQIYQGTWFDKPEDREGYWARPSGTDATSGETTPPGTTR